ncbi:MAG TPA: hypothetical protein VFT99_12190 [Roseiflexaceae bacterium]|nr:hypothetical protein [Roseiflexaceae bacterium]
MNLRTILAHAPLPMLALAASYGVYQYALLYVPNEVALIQAAAFESVYIGLTVANIQDGAPRKRARMVSFGAVATSIIYNTLAGLFHRVPGALVGLPLHGELALAALHGLPLAWVAFLVADLLLHQPASAQVARPWRPRLRAWWTRRKPAWLQRKPKAHPAATQVDTPVVEVAPTVDTPRPLSTVAYLKDVEGLSFTEIGKRLNISRQAAQQRYKKEAA